MDSPECQWLVLALLALFMQIMAPLYLGVSVRIYTFMPHRPGTDAVSGSVDEIKFRAGLGSRCTLAQPR